MVTPELDALPLDPVPVLAGRAKSLAEQWVHEEGRTLPGFRGAYLVGSVTNLADGAALPATSDVDVVLLLARPAPSRMGKFFFRNILLYVSFVEWGQIQAHETILGHFQMGAAFQRLHILDDPTGLLSRIRGRVAKQFASRYWVGQRIQHTKEVALNRLLDVEKFADWHDQVTAWLFGASLTTLILTTAGLRPPTVRRRYMEARELLADRGKLEFYERLLQLLGCDSWSKSQAEAHLAGVTAAFDEAKTLPKGSFPFAADISNAARPIALDGSRDLIEHRFHREAVFWMVATYARCQWIIHRSASAQVRKRFNAGFEHLLADLGIHSFADLMARCGHVRSCLPETIAMAAEVMATTPGIRE